MIVSNLIPADGLRFLEPRGLEREKGDSEQMGERGVRFMHSESGDGSLVYQEA